MSGRPEGEGDSPVSPLTVMVVDDDRTVRNVLSHMLKAMGYRTIVADSARSCLDLAASEQVDAYIVDVQMPEVDGLAVCRELRASERSRLSPIICMTAAGEAAHVNTAFAAGADDYVVKPVNPVVLKARLAGHVERRRAMRATERLRANVNRYISRRTLQMAEEYTATGILPGPIEREVVVLFSDVRGFTQLSQEVEPPILFAALSDNLGMQVDTVYSHNGYVDKFAGDGIMAVFDGETAAERACRCGMDILARTLDAGNQYSDPALKLGVGIHAGPALVGNIGSAQQLDYSVIGETVNLAARLCGQAAPMTAVVSDAVVQLCTEAQELKFTAPCEIRVRGVRDAVAVWNMERSRR